VEERRAERGGGVAATQPVCVAESPGGGGSAWSGAPQDRGDRLASVYWPWHRTCPDSGARSTRMKDHYERLSAAGGTERSIAAMAATSVSLDEFVAVCSPAPVELAEAITRLGSRLGATSCLLLCWGGNGPGGSATPQQSVRISGAEALRPTRSSSHIVLFSVGGLFVCTRVVYQQLQHSGGR